MSINDPYAPLGARQPRLQILNKGNVVGGAISFEAQSNNYYQADTFSARFALNADPNYGKQWWGAQKAPLLLDIQASLDNGATWKSLLIGQVDHMDLHLDAGLIAVDGRDLASVFIDSKTNEAFVNKTSSQVVEALVAKHKSLGLTADVTPTKTLVGRYYGDDHERLSLNAFSRTTTEWNLLCSLAQHEQFDIYVTGTTVHFHPSTPPDSTPWDLVWQDNGPGAPPWMNATQLSMERSMVMAKDVVVVVRSWNSRDEKGYTKYSPSRHPSLQDDNTQQFTYIIPDLSPAEAQDKANKLREQITRNERLITMQAPADLILMPRHMLRVQGTGTSWDQAYYVDWVRRSMSFEAGFTMTAHAKNHSPETQVLAS